MWRCLAGGLLLLCSCAAPELGEVPFFCNNGSPRCPEGYSCVARGGREVCLKNGASTGAEDAGIADGQANQDRGSQVDRPPGQPDARRGDGPAVQWDRGATDLPLLPQDKGTPILDGQGHLGCQSNVECTSIDNPCCCPMPLVPQVWICMPLCFNPFCI